MKPKISYLRKRLDYDARTGLITYKPVTAKDVCGNCIKSPELVAAEFNASKAGMLATSETHVALARSPYETVVLGNLHLPAHQVAWALVHGEWPEKGKHIHHINEDPFDNRIENLELLTPKEHRARHTRQKPPVDANIRNVALSEVVTHV